MSLPVPETSLVDVCSTIFNNTLYTYSHKAFQSLELVQDAQWVNLPLGVAVTNGVCVQSTPKDETDATALFIVGGTANDTAYQGMQRFTFATGKWESIQPTVPVTQNRLYHGAVYLNASDSILVYAGTQDGSMQYSSQTFTIQASKPYDVLAFEAIAPPAISPTLLQWSERTALYIGGSTTNTKAMIFNPSTSWIDLNATLAAPLYNTSNVKSVVINGDDSSKTLYTFDMTVLPNEVNRTILMDGDGNPVSASKAILDRAVVSGRLEDRSAQVEKRENLTVAHWPVYNNTLAPSSTRSSYAVAKDQSGLVVISGGDDKDVLCMFDGRDNTWANATDRLVSKASVQQGLGTASISPSTTDAASSSTTPTSTSTPTSTPQVSSAFPVKILVAVLGSILGVAFILLAILLLFRWRTKRRQFSEAGHQRRASGIPAEKDGLEFSGLPQMSSARQLQNHAPQDSQGSYSSMAILMGRAGQKRSSRGSNTSSQFNKQYKNAISNPIPQSQPIDAFGDQTRLTEEKSTSNKVAPLTGEAKPRGSRGARRGSTRRSSGWNRYWSGGSAMNILGFGSKRNTYASDAAESDGSRYSEHRPSHVTQTSAIIPPLRIGGQPELNRVASGSPTVAHSTRFPMTREMSGQIERPGSVSSLSSFGDYDRHDAFSSGVPASVQEERTWTPVERHDWAGGRGVSNAYTESVYAQTLPRSTIANFPRDTQFPPRQNQTLQPEIRSDMSWLNLGGESRV